MVLALKKVGGFFGDSTKDIGMSGMKGKYRRHIPVL
jgi:hypothetical protein